MRFKHFPMYVENWVQGGVCGGPDAPRVLSSI